MIGFLRLIAGLSSGHVGYGARRTALLALQTAPVLPSCKDNNGQSRPVTEHRPPAWGQQVLQGDYWVQILGTVHRQTSIQIRYRSNFAVPVSQMCSVMQQENRAHTRVSPSALVNQPPLHTHPALGRRLDQDDPGVRAPVICRTGVPGRSAQGTVCRSRSGIPGRFRYWGTMTRAKMAPARSRHPC